MGKWPRVLALIPARGGSKGLPGKNVRPVLGRPLIAWSIEFASRLPMVTRCVVSSDSHEVRSVAQAFGADAPFERPAELALDETPMAPVLRHALEWVEREEGVPYDFVLLLDPTSPCRQADDIEDGLRLLRRRDEFDGVVSVSQPHFQPIWVGVRRSNTDEERLQRYFPSGAGVTGRQQLDKYLRVNGNFYLWRAAFVRRLLHSWMDEGVHGMIEIADVRGIAIDELRDLELLETLVRGGLVALPRFRCADAGERPVSPRPGLEPHSFRPAKTRL